MSELPRLLGLRQLMAITIGTVIGSGIFIVPGAVMRQTGGSVPLSLLVWVAGGVLSLLGALTYAEMGAMRPEAGGLYVYIRDGFGPFPAFFFGWTMFFITGSGTIATLAVAFTAYLGQIVPLARHRPARRGGNAGGGHGAERAGDSRQRADCRAGPR